MQGYEWRLLALLLLFAPAAATRAQISCCRPSDGHTVQDEQKHPVAPSEVHPDTMVAPSWFRVWRAARSTCFAGTDTNCMPVGRCRSKTLAPRASRPLGHEPSYAVLRSVSPN